MAGAEMLGGMQDVRTSAGDLDPRRFAEDRVARLEQIVVELLEKNEQLRQQLKAVGGGQSL